jgi:predicted ArsR family transcriptional regulator
MQAKQWNERFFASTRGRVVARLRRSAETVNELAGALELTDNAVRSHLAGLERDGLVEPQGIRRGLGKPAVVYRLTDQAESLFPKAYGFVLGQLFGLLRERMGAEAFNGLLRDVGKRAASGAEPVGGSVRSRLTGALAVLAEFGGEADVEERADGALIVRGHSCPLASTVREHPAACVLTETLLSELVGATVREECQRGERPRCAFVVDAPKSF